MSNSPQRRSARHVTMAYPLPYEVLDCHDARPVGRAKYSDHCVVRIKVLITTSTRMEPRSLSAGRPTYMDTEAHHAVPH
jgi:hypothetical protein